MPEWIVKYWIEWLFGLVIAGLGLILLAAGLLMIRKGTSGAGRARETGRGRE